VPQRTALYKATVGLIRAYANIADELEPAGYSDMEINRIKGQLRHYLDLREIIRKASGDTLDMKPFEADMRHLIDTYIEADQPRKISAFDDMGLLELIVKTGIANAIASQLGGLKGDKNAIAETIENNVRRKILKERLSDPAYYEKMSALLDEIIALRKAKAIEYEEYLRRVALVARQVEVGQAEDTPEPLKKSPALRALYNSLKKRGGTEAGALERAIEIDAKVREVRQDDWRGVKAREQDIKAGLYEILQEEAAVEQIFSIVEAQSEY